MVLDRPLPPADYNVEPPDARSIQLLIDGLDKRLQLQALSPVVSDYREHLFGYLLGEREHPRPHSSRGYDRLVFREAVRMINCGAASVDHYSDLTRWIFKCLACGRKSLSVIDIEIERYIIISTPLGKCALSCYKLA